MENEQDKIVNEALPKYDRLYSVDEYMTFGEDFRAELYDGRLIVMEVPTRKHQKILMEMSGQLWQFLKGKPCEVYPAPFGVRLTLNEESIFEPDIVVICDESILTERGCLGAPDLIIEILSPSTARNDKKIKFKKFLQAGVREYWIVDPELDLLEVNILENDRYITTIYDENDTVPVTVLKGLEIDLAEVFAE